MQQSGSGRLHYSKITGCPPGTQACISSINRCLPLDSALWSDFAPFPFSQEVFILFSQLDLTFSCSINERDRHIVCIWKNEASLRFSLCDKWLESSTFIKCLTHALHRSRGFLWALKRSHSRVIYGAGKHDLSPIIYTDFALIFDMFLCVLWLACTENLNIILYCGIGSSTPPSLIRIKD